MSWKSLEAWTLTNWLLVAAQTDFSNTPLIVKMQNLISLDRHAGPVRIKFSAWSKSAAMRLRQQI